jgi:hypothetical protein
VADKVQVNENKDETRQLTVITKDVGKWRPRTFRFFQTFICNETIFDVSSLVALMNRFSTVFTPVLPLTEHHAMKAYWGSGGTAPPIL